MLFSLVEQFRRKEGLQLSEDKLVKRLSDLDSCAISDALDVLNINGVAIGLRQITVQKKIVGRVVTVKLVPKTQEQTSNRHLGTAAIEAASNGDVIVVEHFSDKVAGWGGNLAIAASLKGISGVIIDGACRDVDEMKLIDFPVYARSSVPTTARGRLIEQSFNEKINIEGIDVFPNDLVLADASGIVFLPCSKAEMIIEEAKKIMEKEERMATAIRSGLPVSSVMGQNYETMLQKKLNN
jgi:4-hydroxy-4-methyl-2-oxoglutarate aldolase